MERIVDIATDGRHLSAHRGFLLVSQEREEVGRIPLDDIAAIIVHAHGVTWTTSLVVALAERGALMVLCGTNHSPVAVCMPLDGHHGQNARMRAQWDAGKPLTKQLWREIVVAKISWQAAVLEARGIPADAFAMLARRIRSGDPENIEAQAARRYWPLLMGENFRRDREAGGCQWHAELRLYRLAIVDCPFSGRSGPASFHRHSPRQSRQRVRARRRPDRTFQAAG